MQKDNTRNSSDLSKVSYTSRDYASIFNDLVSVIPDVTKIWDSKDESDPGVILIKLMSMLGDCLSYNQDKQALEVYPNTVMQRKNADQIYSLIGYRMHWYRSAIVSAILTNTSTEPATVARFTTFSTGDDNIVYTTMKQIELPSNATNAGLTFEVELVQGLPVTPIRTSGDVVSTSNEAWHSIYGYNVRSSDVLDSRIYFDYTYVDETNIILIDSAGYEWIKKDNIDITEASGRFFDFRVDEYDKPYIKLVDYWESFDVSKFKLFYILSKGEKGEIRANTLTKISNTVVVTATQNGISNYISITNKASSEGKSPETAEEARKYSKRYVNTHDTLVTLDDYTRAVSRLNGIAKCLALDYTTAPLQYNRLKDIMEPLDKLTVVVYVVLTDEYADINKESMSNMIQTSLASFKTLPVDVKVNFEDIEYSYWTVTGKVFLQEPVTEDEARDILVDINTQLRFNFAPERTEFNTAVRYIDVVNTITNANSKIQYVDLDPIKYLDPDRNEVSPTDINGQYTEIIPFKDSSYIDPYKYEFKLKNVPITPGSLIIRLQDDLYTVVDNKNGRMLDTNGILRGPGTVVYENEYDPDGNIIAESGTIKFETLQILNSDITVLYKKNIVSMAKYTNLSTTTFEIAPEYIIRNQTF